MLDAVVTIDPNVRAEGFWDWPIMVSLQELADQTRTAFDPLHLIIVGFLAALLVLYLMNRPAGARDRAPPGGHYLGKITPKSLPGMLIEPEKKKKRKSRAEITDKIRKGAERRRAMENRAAQLGIDVEDLEDDDEPAVRRR